MMSAPRRAHASLHGIGDHECVRGERFRAFESPILSCHGGTPYHGSLDLPRLLTSFLRLFIVFCEQRPGYQLRICRHFPVELAS